MPTQLGVGVKGGCEALIHAARHFLTHKSQDQALIKIDFANAFNSVRRDAVLEAVAQHRPDLLEFVLAAYGTPSILWVGDSHIMSAEGVQQGDPLGPLLFCLALDGPLKGILAEFVSGYLDDVGVGDTVTRLIEQVRALEAAAARIGLRLNHDKCEIIGLDPSQRQLWSSAGLNFMERSVDESVLLGSPLSLAGVDTALSQSRTQLERVRTRLLKLSAHEAFFLLKNCFAIPRLQFLLRTAPCCFSEEVVTFDETVRSLLCAIVNIRLDDVAWSQASLPVRWGGIGVRKAELLAPSAFLASSHASSHLISRLLPNHSTFLSESVVQDALVRWIALSGKVSPSGPEACSQRAWDDGVSCAISSNLLMQAAAVDQARLRASTIPGSGSWLQALPCTNLGLRLGSGELRIAVGLRLGTPLVRAHRCVCGTEVAENGHHGLSCRRSAGRHRRHALANDVILRAIRSVETHAELEPPRLLRGDGKRPDGATLDPWHSGRYLVWDFTCPDTLAPSHIQTSSQAAGAVAEQAESRKRTKYAGLVASGDYIFAPIAVETLGAFGPSALEVCGDIGGRIAERTGDLRSFAFLKQRLGVAVQRGNAAAVTGTAPWGVDIAEN
jgi:hypothetical protein